MHIFIDESGNFTDGKDTYFIVGGFITGDPKRTGKEFRKWQHKKFPKKLRYKTEVKFSDTGLDEDLRLKTLQYLAKQDIRIFYTFLTDSNIPLEYRKKRLESGLLYTEIVVQTLHLLLPTRDLQFRVFRDKRKLKGLTNRRFNKILRVSLLPSLPAKTLIQIEALDSSSHPNIQIADWICGALHRWHNKGENAKQYHTTLKNSIIASQELFENYWGNFLKNKKSPLHKR